MNAIELDGLTKDYGEVLANDDVSFAVQRGEIFGYLGPNGAGKTTTIRMLLGLLSPTAGNATVLGADVRDEQALIDARRRIGYLPDNPAFEESATGQEILDFHASVKGDVQRDRLLELFDPPLDRPVREYSHGNVRKLGLVATFMHDPDLVILDEPTGGLDPLVTQRFGSFLREERSKGLTVLFSSHILGEVRRLCDRVGIIRQGRLVTVEPVESLLKRSGKVVRLVAAEAIPGEALAHELDGVHDLEGGHAGPAPGGNVHQEHDGATDDDSATEGRFHEYTFTYTSDVDSLLATLGEYSLHDCTIEEAPLEDVFLRFYGDESDQADPDPTANPAANQGGGRR